MPNQSRPEAAGKGQSRVEGVRRRGLGGKRTELGGAGAKKEKASQRDKRGVGAWEECVWGGAGGGG